jgi:hypothetical protein
MLRRTQMMNFLLVAKQGATTGGLPLRQNLEVTVGASPPCQPQTYAMAGIPSTENQLLNFMGNVKSGDEREF